MTYNEPKSPLYVYGDKSRLHQVFVNVIDNALKYTKSNGSINVSVSAKDKKVVIEVVDNGCGIDKSEISNITQKFYKSKKCESTRGCGIGLSIVEEIVNAHSGNLKILSEKGIGTTVIITFNLVIKEDTSA